MFSLERLIIANTESRFQKFFKRILLDCYSSQKQARFAMILNNINQKSAAMFGLDARIALAIFGALSVITSAALYSSLNSVDATSRVYEMQEIGKAWEQYYLDTHKNLPAYSTTKSSWNFCRLKTKFLKERPVNVAAWKGPYLSYDVTGDDLFHPEGYKIQLIMLSNGVAFGGASNVGWEGAKCVSTKECSLWIYYAGAKTNDHLKILDKKIDGEIDGAKGDFRWNYYPASEWGPANYAGYLKYMPIQNPY